MTHASITPAAITPAAITQAETPQAEIPQTSHEPIIRFERVAVLGPVDAAVRFIRTAREIGDQRGQRLHVVVLHPDPRQSDAALRAADEVVAFPRDGGHAGDGDRAGNGTDALAEALAAASVDALWPGWDPAAEDPTTPEVCERLGITFIGPGHDTLRAVRDRIAMKRAATRWGYRSFRGAADRSSPPSTPSRLRRRSGTR